MTNEEIESAANAFFAMQNGLNDDWEHTRALALAMRELVSQAYEEAAQRLERRADYVESHMPNHNMAVQELREMSTSIRALKDSFSQETVSA